MTSCDGAAPPPVGVNVENVSSSTVTVFWEAPPSVPGELVGYMVRYRRRGQGEYTTENTTRCIVCVHLSVECDGL